MSRAVFLNGNLMRHVAVMSFTASIGIMAIFAVDFVDMLFISMLGHRELAAAVGYAGTLLFFTNAVNVGLSIAAASLVARTLGAGKAETAREYATSVAMVSVLTGIILPIFIVPNLDHLLGFLGAEGETLQFAIRYCTIIIPTMCFMGLAMVSMAVLRAHGDAKSSMTVTLSGSIINAALDPVLIFGLALGLDGAAYASVIARGFMMIYGIRTCVVKHDGFAKPSFKTLWRDISIVSGIALPAVMTNLATPVGNAIATKEIASYGTDAVAAMAVIGRLTPLAFAVVLALSGAIGPIVGQNFGAQQFDRVRGAFLAGLKFTAAYVFTAGALLFLLRGGIADMFDAQGEMRDLIFLFCGLLAFLQFFNGAVFVCNACFNNLGKPIYSTFLNWGRHTLGTWPFVIVGSIYFGASGVLLGQAIGGIIFALIGFVIVLRLMSHLNAKAEIDEFAGEERLHQVTNRNNW
jgi:putative MATE family efflux protein